eukprot:GHVS01065549.1.p1 GENE.GHVS01065549.1~~GHVS01065549.1.p1  ORF type:complete len:183 (-),score=25.36 GHVS01065549.1:56-604(-)
MLIVMALNGSDDLGVLRSMALLQDVKRLIPPDRLAEITKTDLSYLKGYATFLDPSMVDGPAKGHFGVFIRATPAVAKNDDDKLTDKQTQTFKDHAEFVKSQAAMLNGKVFERQPLPESWKAEKDINRHLKKKQWNDLATIYGVPINSSFSLHSRRSSSHFSILSSPSAIAAVVSAVLFVLSV